MVHFFSFLQYLGSHDIEDYRNKRETSAVMSELKKRSGKAPKPKAIITLYAKEVVVMDEKSKVCVVAHVTVCVCV